MINKVLIPGNPILFKPELLKRKRAKRTLFYKDGSVKIEMWNADRFKPSSDLMNNIDSQLWRRKDKAEIVKAIYEIVDLDDGFIDTKNAEVGELYIHYVKGWSSFETVGEHMMEYVIENGKITISYHVGFGKGRTKKKTIPAADMQALIAILEKAVHTGTLAPSNSLLRTVHGPVCTYHYQYKGIVGYDCGVLITDNALSSNYNDLIDRLVK